ncbi:hypothetical protein ACWD63_31455, partial [Streptomyces clavifer]
RWRCTLCGNLTRFDVTRSSKVVEYVHLDLAGPGAAVRTARRRYGRLRAMTIRWTWFVPS